MAIGEPYETIFVTERLGVSIALVGLVWTVSSFVGLPLQFVGGVVCDRVGRRPLMVVSGVTLVVFYLVMATAHSLWPVALVAVLESAIGWPLCLVACNAMIADLLPPGRRPVAYSVWRAAINVGMVVGPLVALALLAAGVDYRGLFVVASLGSALFVAAVVVAIPETKPAGAAAADGPETTFRRGLRVVLGDRRFVLFSAAAFLPLLCYGQFLWIFPVYLTDTLGLPAGSWAALLALNALVVVLVGPLFVHLTRGSDALWLMALGAALIGLGLGLTAFVSNLAAIVPLMMLLALGEALFWPISSAAVSEMAPGGTARHLHGRLDAGRLGRTRHRAADRRPDHGAGRRARELRRRARREPGRGGAVRGAGAARAPRTAPPRRRARRRWRDVTDPLLPGQPPDAGAGVPEAAAVGGFAGLAAAVRGSPHAFRVLIAGTAAFCLAISVGMPYETIFVTSKLGVSVAVVGVVWTVSALAGLPLQVVGGVACDRLGRRPLLFTSAVTILIFYAVMALSHSLWPIAAVAILEAMFGWPLYLVACNAMIADLLPMGRRPVAYSVWRGAINVGTVVGPGIAALLLSAGLGYRTLFTVASAGCAVFVAIVVLALPETRPPDAGRTGEGEVGFVRGLGLVAADRRFLLFSGAALLPLLCLGQFLWIFPVYLTDTLGMPASAWAALLAGSAAVVALTGPVVVHLTRRTDKLWLMALSALLMGLGLGLSAFVSSVAAIVPLVLVFALGEALFWPISSAAVSEMAPSSLRGTYMGAWTLVDCAGRGVGPLIGGVIMAQVGGRQNFAVALAVSLVGAALFAALALRGRAARRAAGPPPDRSSLEPGPVRIWTTMVLETATMPLPTPTPRWSCR